jgi:TPR repeat protein
MNRRPRRNRTPAFKAGLLALVWLVGGAVPVAAGPLEDASAAYGRADYATALRLFRSFAEQGNAYAQFNLGLMYFQGRGVPQDYGTAAAWYRRAADQGYAAGQANLGTMYVLGQGVPQDYVMAYSLLDLAAAGLPNAAVRSSTAALRDAVAGKMSPAQIAEAQRLARDWKPKSY